MIILPAIDLKGGRCVRLKQGRAEDETVYNDDPVAQALQWQKEGAEYLHVVDLDGAFEGRPVHTEVIKAITDALDIPVELGGGLRTDDHIAEVLAAGLDRAILGTRACEHPEQLEALVSRFGNHIAVGIDASNGKVQTKGWVHTSEVEAVDLAKQVSEVGVQTIIYTDTSRDGMMQGVNLEAMDAMCKAVTCNVIASGGVTNKDDVVNLRGLKHDNLYGAIVGKALYDGAVCLSDILN